MGETKSEHPAGLFYGLKDYAGLGRRLLILSIDAMVLFIGYVLTMVAFGLSLLGTSSFHIYALCFGAFCYLYLAVLARSRFGTVGYALTAVRIVDLTGERPSLACMSYRSVFALFGPLNALLDLVWLGGDNNRQALRDKLAGTYVIRRGAVPAGVGPQKLVFISFLGWNLLVREVSQGAT